MPSKPFDEERILSDLYGNTLLVYWHMLKRQTPVGVREVQRALGFSSSSTASYHLEKLKDLGLTAKNPSGDYKISRTLKVGVMSAFLFVGGFAFPKHFLYALATSSMILFFALLFHDTVSLIVVVALLPGMIAAAIFWYETMKIWRRKPTFR